MKKSLSLYLWVHAGAFFVHFVLVPHASFFRVCFCCVFVVPVVKIVTAVEATAAAAVVLMLTLSERFESQS